MGTLDTAKPFYRLEIYEPEATEPKFVISPNVFLDTEKPSNNSQASPDVYITNLNISLFHKNRYALNLIESIKYGKRIVDKLRGYFNKCKKIIDKILVIY